MGAACCIAAKDKTIVNGPPSETLPRLTRHSPSWSFRRDNRGRVAGEETSVNSLRDRGDGNDAIEAKSSATGEPVVPSEEGSPLDSSRSFVWQKYPVPEGHVGISRLAASDKANSRNLVEAKETSESLSASYPSPVKRSPSVRSVPSVSTSPLSSLSQPLPPNPTSRLRRRSPGHLLLRQVSDSQIPQYKLNTLPTSEEVSLSPLTWDDESVRGSNGGSLDSWSVPNFSEPLTSWRERWSFDTETLGLSQENITRSSRRISGSPSSGLQICGVCTKVLTERASRRWTSQKRISTNEVAVVSVLTCGHVYHAECLEYMTPEINKYDPDCPVCTFGAKEATKMSEKPMKVKLDSKARKQSRKRVVSSDFEVDHHGNSGTHESGPKRNSNLSIKGSSAKPFLRRHFSFGSKSSRSLSGNQPTRRLSFFWPNSSKD